MMIPQFGEQSKMQQLYLKEVVLMSDRKGPLVTNRRRLISRVQIEEKQDYRERSTLMSGKHFHRD